jgi:hypothetical protein
MNHPIVIFRNPASNDDDVLRAAANIAPGGAPATLWSDVANDTSFRAFHRSLAVYELIRRHLPRPATLDQAASLLAGGFWLCESKIEKIEVMGSEIPVVVPEGGAAFIIRLPKGQGGRQPEMGIYLALDFDLSAGQLRQALMTLTPTLAYIRISDFFLFPEDLLPIAD